MSGGHHAHHGKDPAVDARWRPAAARAIKRADRQQCETGKLRYRTQRKARLALDAYRGDDRRAGPNERYVYRCPLCDGWHLTKQAPRNRPERKVSPHEHHG